MAITEEIKALISIEFSRASADNALKLARDSLKPIDQDLRKQLKLDILDFENKIITAKRLLKENLTEGVEQKIRLNLIDYKSNLTEAKRQLNNLVNTGSSDLSRLQQKFNQVNGGAGVLSKTFSSIKNYIVGAFAAQQIVSFGKYLLDVTSQVQQAKNAFDVLTGSQQTSNKLLSDIQVFAKSTPFNQLGLIDASKRMLAFGFTANQILPALNAVGNAVSAVGGNKETLDSVIRALGQMGTKGRVVQQEVNQIAETGIPIFAILKDKLKLTDEQLGNIGKQGISAAKAIPLILEALNEKFGGLMAKQSKTISGAYSNLVDTVEIAMAQIGKSQQDELTSSIQGVANFISQNSNLIVGYAGDIINTFKGIFNLVGDIVIGGFNGISQITSIFFSSFQTNTEKELIKAQHPWVVFFNSIILGFDTLISAAQVAVNTIGAILNGIGQKIKTASAGDWATAGVKTWKSIIAPTKEDNIFTRIAGVVSQKDAQELVKKNKSIRDGLIEEDASQTGRLKELVRKEEITKEYTDLNKKLSSLTSKQLSDLRNAKGKQLNQYSVEMRNAMGRIKNIEGELGINQLDLSLKGKFDTVGNAEEKAIKKSTDLLETQRRLEEQAVEDSLDTNAEKARKLIAIEEKFQNDKKKLEKGATGEIVDTYKEQKKAAEDTYSTINKEVNSSEKEVEKLNDSLVKAKEKFSDLQKEAEKTIRGINGDIKELEKGSIDDLAKRNVEIDKEILDSQKALQEKQIDFADDRKASTAEEIDALNKKIEKLKEEKTFISTLTTSEQRAEATKFAGLSEAQQIDETMKKKRAELEERKRILELISKGEFEKIGTINNIKNQEFALEEQEKFTKAQQDIKDAQIKLDNEKQILEGLKNAKINSANDAKNALGIILANETKNFLDEYRARTKAVQDLLDLQRQNIAGVTTGAGTLGIIGNTGSTTNNTNNDNGQISIAVNATVHNQADINALASQLAEKIKLAKKGVK